MIHRPYFFDGVRATVFGGKMTAAQVEGCEQLLDYPCEDDRHRGYILATTFHETARTMEPITEIGKGKGKVYGQPDPTTGMVYYGRGYVQLTWKRNYELATAKLAHDFVHFPDDVMIPDYARRILYVGMTEGWFTGKRLGQYLTTVKTDFKEARRVVNGLDKAAQIAGYAVKFLNAISHTPEPRG